MLLRANLLSVAVALVVAAALVSCTAPRARSGPRIDPTFEGAFESLELALADHEDALARRILERMEARTPTGDTLAHLESFRRILDGRDLGRSLDLQLEVRPRPDGLYRVFLLASYPGEERLRISSGPGRLRLLLNGVNEVGLEQRKASSAAVFGTEAFEIRAGEQTRVRLGDYELPTGGALAVRATWDLSLMPGEVVRGKHRGVPVNAFDVRSVSVVRLAAYLPTGEVEPEELVRYLTGDAFSSAAMLERTVRIPADRRAETLDLLGPVVERMTALEMERVVPALRWLSGNRQLGGDPRHWRAWMELRAEWVEGVEVDRADENTDLVLPSADGS